MTANAELAAQLRRQADDAIARRRVLLVAAVALAESATIAGARKILDEWAGPASIRQAAIALLDGLAKDVPAQGRAAPGGKPA
jgi:hypothetical protein